ncbi:unnamed protein product [Lupinus luteus]|uniref:Transmembrane protein n=1 Tax=Lupinus luteus TaxID=3873 RepID=A0AAV1X8V5_LUPLU
MARPLHFTSHMHNLQFSTMPMIMSLFFVVLAVLFAFSIVTFLCGTRKMRNKNHKTSETVETPTGSNDSKFISKLNSNLSSRALSMVKMLSWKKVEVEGDGEGDYGDKDEEVLWRKNILMGERCRPIDFSGKILYDSEGSMLPDLCNQNEEYQH